MLHAHDLLVAIALKEESQGLFETRGIPVLYTGLGKLNAAIPLTQALISRPQRPRMVINFGTAGSPAFPTHALVEITRFVQRDMDVSALGFAPGVTPFDDTPATLEVPKRLKSLPSGTCGTCGTGDRFETGRPLVECDVVDMEAFAMAKVCHHLSVPFVSLKYITDGSDPNAHNDWAANLPRAAACFIEAYDELRAHIL